MRFFISILSLFFVLHCYSQSSNKISVSGIVITKDSIPIQGVAIINIKTGKIVHTDKNGNFHMEFAVPDSLLIYHIAFKRQFVNNNDNRKYFMLEPEVHELMQVDVLDKTKLERRHLDSTVVAIKQIAPTEKLTGYDKKSSMQYFIDENGTHTKGFSPYFGPSFYIPFEKNTVNVLKREQKRQLKKLTSHYHLVKK